MATAVVLASAAAFAQEDYPARPMRLIVPFAPGGGADISARTIAQKLTERFGQQVVVDNRPGAGGNVGAELVLEGAAGRLHAAAGLEQLRREPGALQALASTRSPASSRSRW